MMKNKKNILVISIIIVTLLVIGLISYMINSKKSNINEEKNINKTNNINEIIKTNQNNVVTENSVNEKNTTKLTKVEQEDYTTLTLGKLKQSDKDETPIGSKIKAYPLNIEEVLPNKAVAMDYRDLYEKQMVALKGYVHHLKDGYFVLSSKNMENIDENQGNVIVEDKYIKKDYNWDIKDGDFIEIVGWFRGTHIGNNEYWMVLNNVFKVKQ